VRDAYAYALEHCGVEAADAILVAVHPLGHGQARRAGLGSAWVNNLEGGTPRTSRRPIWKCRR